MCLLVVASCVVAGEPLIVGANRDEVLERPSTAVTVLDEGPPRIVGGRDELSGGTWLAVNELGVCAGLTNEPMGEAKDPSKRSRANCPSCSPSTPRPPRPSMRCCLGGARPPTTARGSWSAIERHCSSSTSPARAMVRGRTASGNSCARKPGARRDLAEGRSGPAGARRHPTGAGRRGSGRRLCRVLAPTGTPRARSDRMPPIAYTSRRSGRGRPASCGFRRARSCAARLGGRRASLHDSVRGRQRPLDAPGPGHLGERRCLSRGRAACSAGDGAGRRRPRGACDDPPRSR